MGGLALGEPFRTFWLEESTTYRFLEGRRNVEIMLRAEPSGASYHALLDFVLRRSTHAAFIRQVVSPASNQRLEGLLSALEPDLEEVSDVDSWPGTTLMVGYSAKRYLYRSNPRMTGVLKAVANGLFDWANPNLPDDLHFLFDETVVLGQVAHERYAWLDLSKPEGDELLRHPPNAMRSILPSAEG